MTNIQVRNLSDSAHERLKRGAQARGWTMGEYIERLLDLHTFTMSEASAAQNEDTRTHLNTMLTSTGLGPVRF